MTKTYRFPDLNVVVTARDPSYQSSKDIPIDGEIHEVSLTIGRKSTVDMEINSDHEINDYITAWNDGYTKLPVRCSFEISVPITDEESIKFLKYCLAGDAWVDVYIDTDPNGNELGDIKFTQGKLVSSSKTYEKAPRQPPEITFSGSSLKYQLSDKAQNYILGDLEFGSSSTLAKYDNLTDLNPNDTLFDEWLE